MRTIIVSFAATFLLTAAAFAQSQDVRQDHSPIAAAHQRNLERYDADRDGVLDAEEQERRQEDLRARFEQVQARLNPQHDANRDGRLDPEEQEAAVRDSRERMAAFRGAALRRYDANHDGVLDAGERQQMGKSQAAFLRRVHAWTLAHYDANHNGVLDPQERAALMARGTLRRQTAN